MYGTNEIIKAGRITNVAKLASLSEDYTPGFLFSLFLAPIAEQGVESGDILAIDAVLPESNGEAVEVPVVVGDWSPVVFSGINADEIDLTKVDAYVAPIKDFQM